MTEMVAPILLGGKCNVKTQRFSSPARLTPRRVESSPKQGGGLFTRVESYKKRASEKSALFDHWPSSSNPLGRFGSGASDESGVAATAFGSRPVKPRLPRQSSTSDLCIIVQVNRDHDRVLAFDVPRSRFLAPTDLR